MESISSGGGEPTKHVPGFESKIVNVDEVIKVDAYMAGCPPKPEDFLRILNKRMMKNETKR